MEQKVAVPNTEEVICVKDLLEFIKANGVSPETPIIANYDNMGVFFSNISINKGITGEALPLLELQ